MWIFAWEATEKRNAQCQNFSNLEDAWAHFSNLTMKNFPDVILFIDIENSTSSMQMNWSKFIDIYNETIEPIVFDH